MNREVRSLAPARHDLEWWIDHGYRAHVNVEFTGSTSFPWASGIEHSFTGDLLSQWREIEREFPGVTFRPLCPDLEVPLLERLQAEAQASAPGERLPRLRNFFTVECPRGRPPHLLAERLGKLSLVARARLEDPPARPPVVNWQDDPLANPRSGDYQRYLHEPPAGVSAPSVWGIPGGDGLKVVIADLEQGWYLNHPDLPSIPPPQPPGLNYGALEHGVGVLGILFARDDSRGCVGLAPRAQGRVVSEYWSDPPPPPVRADPQDDGAWHSRARALLFANSLLGPGDILLIESQIETPDSAGVWHGYPVEYDSFDHGFIRFASRRGVVVVECAGDSRPDDLDDPALGGLFTEPGRHSGAIMVSAGEWKEDLGGFQRAGLCNFGSRVDCFSWGEAVVTLGPPGAAPDPTMPAGYVSTFNSTSSAAAIVAGCAALVQSLARRAGQAPLHPEQVRGLLRDWDINTRTRGDAFSLSRAQSQDRIGVQPRLDRIAERMWSSRPQRRADNDLLDRRS